MVMRKLLLLALLLALFLFFGCLDFDRPNNIFAIDKNVSGGDVNNFLDLNDTPVNYVGEGNKCVAVKGAEDGLEFIVCASGGSIGDGNFYSIEDFNKLFWRQEDANLTFWKQVDLNSLLQFPDFNGMLQNFGEGQGWNLGGSSDGNFYSLDGNKVYFTQEDLNALLQIPDFNEVYVSWIDGNLNYWIQADLNSILQIPDFNSVYVSWIDANLTFIKLSDSNDFARLFYEVIADWNVAVLNAQDWNLVFVPRVELNESGDSNAGSNLIGVPSLNGINNLTESMIVYNSAGRVSGGNISDGSAVGGRDINVSSGVGTIRIADDHDANLLFFSWSDSNGLVIGDENVLFVGVEYNAGSPQVVTKVTDVWNLHDEFALGSAVFQNGVIHVENDPHYITNFAGHTLQRFYGTEPLERDERKGGLIFGETGTRNVTVSQGSLWDRVTEFSISAFDSSSVDQNFDCYFRDGATGFNVELADSQWDNLNYDDGTGTLNSLNNNKYATLWFYLDSDEEVTCVYGRIEWNTFAQAETEAVPSTIPLRLSVHARLIGRLIFQQNAGVASEISSVFSTVFSANAVSDHGNLAGLSDDDHLQYYLRSDANIIFWKEIDLNSLIGVNINELDTGGNPDFRSLDLTQGLSVGGNASFTGNVITGTARFLMDLVPNDDSQEDLGVSTLRWRNLFLANKASLWDLNVGSGFIGNNDLNFDLLDLNWSVQSQCSGDANSVLTSGGACQFIGGYGGGGLTENIFSQGSYSDLNFWRVDLNAQDVNVYAKHMVIGTDKNPIADSVERGVVVGGQGTSWELPSTTTFFRALSSEVNLITTASIIDVTGYYSGLSLTGSDDLTNLIGALGYGVLSSGAYSGTLTNLIGLRATLVTGGATVTNAFGLLIDDVSGAVNNYAIKTGTGLVWFGEDANIQRDLNVGGVSHFDGNVTVEGLNGRVVIGDDNSIEQGNGRVNWCHRIETDGNYSLSTC